MRTFYAFSRVQSLLALAWQQRHQLKRRKSFTILWCSVRATRRSFYSSSPTASWPRCHWPIATTLDVRAMGSTACINGGLASSCTPHVITRGMGNGRTFIIPRNSYRNNQTDWSNAAFSQGGDAAFDPGWGVYDVVTHIDFIVTAPVHKQINLEEARVVEPVRGVYDVQFANSMVFDLMSAKTKSITTANRLPTATCLPVRHKTLSLRG